MNRPGYWLSKWKWLIGLAIALALLNLVTGQKPPHFFDQHDQQSPENGMKRSQS